MPYSGPDDSKLPDHIKARPKDDRDLWVKVWNDSFSHCQAEGGSECEGKAFRDANSLMYEQNETTIATEENEGPDTQNITVQTDGQPDQGQDTQADQESGDGEILTHQYIILNASMGLQEGEGVEVKRIVHTDGREYLVAPTVAIVEGVMNNILYLEQEVMAYPDAWSGRPLVVSHPQNESGEFVTANSPEVFTKSLGYFFNADWVNGALVGEWWLDVGKAEGIGGQAIETIKALEAGLILEQSTGLYADIMPQAGVFNEIPYTGVAVNIRPDHFAILFDEEGACSVRDGCGTPRVRNNIVTETEGGESDEIITINLGESWQKLKGLTINKIKQAIIQALDQGLNTNESDEEGAGGLAPDTPDTITEESILTMEREELIEKILSLELPGMTRPMLEAGTDEDLLAIWTQFGGSAEEANTEANTEEEVPASVSALALPPEIREVATLLQDVGGVQAIREAVEAGRAAAQMEATQLTEAIMSVNRNVTPNDLASIPIVTLRKLAGGYQSLIAQPNYMVNAAGIAQPDQGEFSYGWNSGMEVN